MCGECSKNKKHSHFILGECIISRGATSYKEMKSGACMASITHHALITLRLHFYSQKKRKWGLFVKL